MCEHVHNIIKQGFMHGCVCLLKQRERERDSVVKDLMLESHGGKVDGSKLLLLMSLQSTKISDQTISEKFQKQYFE